jgi:membrane fusion protein (multidrug efflux system)
MTEHVNYGHVENVWVSWIGWKRCFPSHVDSGADSGYDFASILKPEIVLAFVLATGPASLPTTPAAAAYSSHLMVDQEVVVASRITGIVETISVDRGSLVAKGQGLANLDPREADADVRQSKEDMDLRRAEWERAKALSEESVMSRADLDTAKARYAVAVAAYEKAKTLRDYTVIRAPFAGMVTEKIARVGQKVIDIQNQPLFKVTAFEPLLARIYVAERELLTIRRGAPVEILLTSFPGAKATGWVEYISPTVDAGSGTFEVIVRVRRDPSQPMLRPGVAVQVRLANPHGS